ncbi:uncharacterized protein [Diadema setosum]|uniref:uncharacterized protein n=1 Tax=Diadema setosum TaxID=31175 RepID=UPI003B3A42E0
MANQVSLCGFAILALVSVASAQMDCYDCSFTYVDSRIEDLTNCSTVLASSTSTTSCSGSCYTEISLSSGRIRIQRGCDSTPTDCNNCTDIEECKVCCDTSNNCNSESLESILSTKALTHTCYACRYSEIPGVHSDSGCGLKFDATSPAVYSVECPGMCYSSKSLIPRVEEIYRGCSYFGNECDYEDDKEVIREVRNLVQHRYSCCVGDKCNHSTSLPVGLATIIIGATLGIMF